MRATAPYIILGALWILSLYSIYFIYCENQILTLTDEDGVVEWMGALCCLGAAITFVILYRRSQSKAEFWPIKRKKNLFFMVLGMLFLFGFLEEISWGQRLMGIETPAFLKDLNQQGELNVHNLPMFSGYNEMGEKKSGLAFLLDGNKLLTLFWFTYCLAIPLLCRFSGRIRMIVEKVDLPVVPLFFGAILLVNYPMSRIISTISAFDSPELLHSVQEVKEANITMIFFLIALWFLNDQKRSSAGIVTTDAVPALSTP